MDHRRSKELDDVWRQFHMDFINPVLDRAQRSEAGEIAPFPWHALKRAYDELAMRYPELGANCHRALAAYAAHLNPEEIEV